MSLGQSFKFNDFSNFGVILSDWGAEKYHFLWPKSSQNELKKDEAQIYLNDYLLTYPKALHSCHVYTINQKTAQGLFPEKLAKPISEWSHPDKSLYQRHFDSAFQRFETGQLKKCVLFAQIYAKCSRENFMNLALNNLKTKNKEAFYFAHFSKDSCYWGWTPELLFETERRSVVLTALAGTQTVNKTKSMIEDSKLVEEHRLVMEDIQKQVNQELNWSELVEVTSGSLKHLKSTAKLQNQKNVDLKLWTELLHPTAALGCFPRIKLKDQEPHWNGLERGAYGAPLGIQVEGEMQSVVLIRGAFWKEGRIKIFAGGGVTPESDFETEWEEIRLKFKSIKESLNV